MNNLTKIVAAILVMAALGLAFVAWWLGSRPPPTLAPAPVAAGKLSSQHYEVIVAARALEAGKAITTNDISLVTLPINPAGAFDQASSVVGKVPLIDIGIGTPITESGLASGLSVKLADGERAVAIPVDEIVGAGNRVQPGDYVDVFFTLKQSQDIATTQSRLLLSRVQVLSYGAAVIGTATSGGSAGVAPVQQSSSQSSQSAQASPQGQQVARTAVLATQVADVNRLLLATQNGKLTLALRNPSDETISDMALFPPIPAVLSGKRDLTRDQQVALTQPDNQAFAGIEMDGLSSDSKSSAHKPGGRNLAAARPAGPASARGAGSTGTVEVIRGMQRESVAF